MSCQCPVDIIVKHVGHASELNCDLGKSMFLGLLVNAAEVLGSSTSLALIFASSYLVDIPHFATFEQMSCNVVIYSYSLCSCIYM